MDDIIDIGNNYENVMAIYNEYLNKGTLARFVLIILTK